MYRDNLSLIGFNPRTRDGCEVQIDTRKWILSRFNPRTRDGCECFFKAHDFSRKVSIHAPVMGANVITVRLKKAVSFNPRTRDGCECWH